MRGKITSGLVWVTPAILKSIATICFVLALNDAALAADRAPDDEASRIYKYCFNPKASMAEGRECLSRQEARVSRDLDAAARKKLFILDEIARRSDDGPRPYGKETSEKAKANFAAEQSAWATYSTSLCQGRFDISEMTAGAEDDAALCRLTSRLRRIRDLR